jgi:outer membrane beta-barrel protein
MKRWIGALAFVGASAVGSSAMAQEVQISGPLAGAPSCRRCVQYRAQRFVVAPSFGITLQDDFQRAMVIGVQAAYHFNDIVGLGLYAGYAAIQIPTPLSAATASYSGLPSPADPSMRVNEFRASYNVPDQAQFSRQLGRMGLILGLPQLTITPLRGKLALFQNVFIDADVSVFAAPAVVLVEERRNFDAFRDNGAGGGMILPPTDPDVLASQTARSTRPAFTGMFGAGFNFYINRFLSLSFEYRAFPFSWNTSGTDENSTAQTCGDNTMQSCAGSPDYLVRPMGNTPARGMPGGRFLLDENDRSFRFNQMVNFSLNIFPQTTPRISE